MSCTRVLHAIGSYPQPAAIPIDLAKCLSLSRRQSRLTLSPTTAKQGQQGQVTDSLPRSGLHSPYSSLFYLHSPVPKAPSPKPKSCFRRGGITPTKKRVVFADAMGLALAAVRLFIPETPSSDSTLLMKAAPVRLQGQQPLSGVREPQQQHQQQQHQQQQRYEPSLGFPPPMLDFKRFLARLRETGVHLQSCSVSEQCLTGNVSVCHIGVDRAVTIRVTFDSWRSHHDIPCTFLQKSPFGGSDIDVFAFNLCLPKNIDPKEQVEFCVHVSRGPGLTPLVDDNMGQNYRLCPDKDGSSSGQSDASRFYPTLTNRLSRSSPLSASVVKQSAGKLSYFQRSLMSRVGGEGSTGDWSRLYPALAVR